MSTNTWKVWLSGGSSGIGAQLARDLVARGCDVAVFARREDKLRDIEVEAQALPGAGRILVQVGDVSDKARVHEAVRECEAEFGRIDWLILNAGWGDSFFPAENFDTELIERITAINYHGPLYAIEAALPGMLARQSGCVVGISSIAAIGGMPTAAPYCSSKAAFSTFLQSLRVDLHGSGVRFVTVLPGFVKTPLTDRNHFPMPFLQTPEAASARIISGIERGLAEIHFPRRFTLALKLFKRFPRAVFEWGLRRTAKRGFHKSPGGK